jgi:protein gp37
MSDLFHPGIPNDFVASAFATMVRADWHVFQILTKRPERALELAGELPWPPNIWMGVTIENNRWTSRADLLRLLPAKIRFISAEPLLGPLPDLDLMSIDWLIAGGESGSRHRSPQPEWFGDLRDRCIANGTAFFFKQWGGRTPKVGGRLLEGRTWDEMPIPRA